MPDKKQTTAEIINPGLGDIEKVRDILFGKYVANFEERFAALEERLEADIGQLRQRLSDKIDTMDDVVNQSLKKLDEQIATERQSRDADLHELSATLQEAETKLQHSISLMEDQANQDLQTIRDTIKHTREELAKEAETHKQQLQSEKVSRQALALMLDEVAVKLRGES